MLVFFVVCVNCPNTIDFVIGNLNFRLQIPEKATHIVKKETNKHVDQSGASTQVDLKRTNIHNNINQITFQYIHTFTQT